MSLSGQMAAMLQLFDGTEVKKMMPGLPLMLSSLMPVSPAIILLPASVRAVLPVWRA